MLQSLLQTVAEASAGSGLWGKKSSPESRYSAIHRHWAGVERQHIRDGVSGVLLHQGIVPLRQQSFVERGPEMPNPNGMKIVHDAGLYARPIVYRHGPFSGELRGNRFYPRRFFSSV